MKKLFFLLTVITIGLAQEEVAKPSFRIVAPQVICRDVKNSNDEKPKQITISMQTQGGQLLNYRVQIYFEILGGYRGQQHSLKLWNSVRRLENKINTKDTMLISQKNQINVNNAELTSGVYYIFKIVGIDDKGVYSDSQNYTVTFSDGKIKRTNPDGTIIPDGVSFQLLGAENTYADVEYMVEALVTFCEQRYDYIYKWEISGLTIDQADWARIPGHILRIPAGQLRGGGLHKITVSLLQSNDSSIIIYQSITVKVLERGFTVSLVPEGLSFGISKTIEFNLHYHDFDNTEETPEIQWTCELSGSSEPCPNFEISNNFVQAAEFYSKGDYVISAMVTLANTSKTVTSTIKVDPDIIVQTVFREASLQDIPSGHGFQLETTIDDLIPNCQAKWTVVNETDYEYFDAEMFPNGLGNLTVLDMEGNFLSELVDYANTTISRDIMLNVPDVNVELGWLGLKPNAKYKFRLITTCPAPISDVDNLPTELVSSFVDVTVSTNQPPIGQALEVTPLNGTALKTIFKISTGVAGDLDIDYPLKYTFQCLVEGFTINLGEYYDNMVTSVILPYSNDQIRTMYEVCDSRSACSIIAGPNVTMNSVAISQEEFSNIILQMSSSFDRMEYENALKVALIAGISFKNMKDTQRFEELQNYTNKLIAAEIGRLQERRDDARYYLPREVIISFVRSAQKTMSIFSETEENLQNLVQLLTSTTVQNANESTKTRKRRSVHKKSSYRNDDGYIGEIQAHLDVEGSLLNSSNPAIVKAAKYNMTQNVHRHLMGLCKHAIFSAKSFDKPSVEFEIRQASSIQLMHNNFTVPMKGEFLPAYVSFNSMLLAGVNIPSRFCVGTIKYPSDYLTGDTGQDGSHETYEILVIKVNSDNEKLVVNLTDAADLQNFDLFVPFYREEEASNIQCQIFENTSWTSEPCQKVSITKNYIKCKCNRVGYFRAIPIGLTVPVANVSTTSPNTSDPALPTALTVLTENESTAAAVTTEWTETEADTMEPTTQLAAVTLPVTVLATIEVPTTMLALRTTILPQITQMTATVLSIAPPTIPDKSSLTNALQPIVSTMIPHKDNLTMIESGIKSVSSGSIAGFVLAGIFIVLGLSIGIGMYVYYRRSTTDTLAQQMDDIASEIRESTPGIKYARFHDENTMRGDYHNETLFNVQ